MGAGRHLHGWFGSHLELEGKHKNFKEHENGLANRNELMWNGTGVMPLGLRDNHQSNKESKSESCASATGKLLVPERIRLYEEQV